MLACGVGSFYTGKHVAREIARIKQEKDNLEYEERFDNGI